MTQGHHWIDSRRATGGNARRQECRGDQEHDRHSEDFRIRRSDVEQLARDHSTSRNSCENADRQSVPTGPSALGAPSSAPGRIAECEAEPDLFRPLLHRIACHAVEAHSSEQQAQGSEQPRQAGKQILLAVILQTPSINTVDSSPPWPSRRCSSKKNVDLVVAGRQFDSSRGGPRVQERRD